MAGPRRLCTAVRHGQGCKWSERRCQRGARGHPRFNPELAWAPPYQSSLLQKAPLESFGRAHSHFSRRTRWEDWLCIAIVPNTGVAPRGRVFPSLCRRPVGSCFSHVRASWKTTTSKPADAWRASGGNACVQVPMAPSEAAAHAPRSRRPRRSRRPLRRRWPLRAPCPSRRAPRARPPCR